jgi:hypothetical protein
VNPRAHTGRGYRTRAPGINSYKPSASNAPLRLELSWGYRKLTHLRDEWKGTNPRSLALTGDEEFVIVTEGGGIRRSDQLRRAGNQLQSRSRWMRHGVDFVAFGPEGRYFLQFNDGDKLWSDNLSESMLEELRTGHIRKNSREEANIELLVFAPDDGWYIKYDDGSSAWDKLPVSLKILLRARRSNPSLAPVQELSIGVAGRWFIRFADGRTTDDIPYYTPLYERLTRLRNKNREVWSVVFASDGLGYAIKYI